MASEKVVQIFFCGSDDATFDMWIDICIDMVPKDDPLHRIIASFERHGQRLSHHVLCWPYEYSVSDTLSKEELMEMRNLDTKTYKSFAPAPDTPCIIVGRYVVKYN
jgi:hypothetical protein